MPIDIVTVFPNLRDEPFSLTSQATRTYNCIAWAAGENHRWWWPDNFCYWPVGVLRAETIEAFQLAFRTLGYEVCDNGDFAEGWEKVAIYAKDGIPKHACRQIEPDKWSSKLGSSYDISHTLKGIECPDYGVVACFMHRELR